MSEFLSVKIVNATIDRGREVIHVSVPEHEIPVLQVIHGQKEVKVIDPYFEDGDLPMSAEAEYARLTRKYKRINAPNPVATVFPAGPRDLERVGFSLGVAEEAAAVSGGVKLRKPNKKPSPGTASRSKAA